MLKGWGDHVLATLSVLVRRWSTLIEILRRSRLCRTRSSVSCRRCRWSKRSMMRMCMHIGRCRRQRGSRRRWRWLHSVWVHVLRLLLLRWLRILKGLRRLCMHLLLWRVPGLQDLMRTSRLVSG